jgi:hypothetical protein
MKTPEPIQGVTKPATKDPEHALNEVLSLACVYGQG